MDSSISGIINTCGALQSIKKHGNMIKKTLYFGNPTQLRKKDMQLQIELTSSDDKQIVTIPIEDIGVIVLDHPQIMLSQALISSLNENNVAILSCDAKHLPFGLMLPMFAHHAFTEKMYQQLECSLPLKKNLWQQTIIAKISNQAALLKSLGVNDSKMHYYVKLGRVVIRKMLKDVQLPITGKIYLELRVHFQEIDLVTAQMRC